MPNLKTGFATLQNRRRIARITNSVADKAKPDLHTKPIVFFIASARLQGLSQNAAFSQLTSWGLRLAGVPVKHFVCKSGMKHCVLGTNRSDYHTPPPCEVCIAQSKIPCKLNNLSGILLDIRGKMFLHTLTCQRTKYPGSVS